MEKKAKCLIINNNHDLIEALKAHDRVIALFTASWCPFCIRFLPIFEKHTDSAGLSFVIVQDDEETIADHYSVDVYPTMLFFDKGLLSKRLDGILGVGLDEKQLVQFVNECLYPAR